MEVLFQGCHYPDAPWMESLPEFTINNKNRPRVGKYRCSMYGICTYMWPKCIVDVFVHITVPWSIWDTWILWAMIYPRPWIPSIHWENVHDPGVPGYHQPREDALCALSCDEIFSNAMRWRKKTTIKKAAGEYLLGWTHGFVIGSRSLVSWLVYNLLQGRK